MKKANTWLLSYSSDTYSQFGEDGIIEQILKILPKKDNWCVEFGAWDGLHLSNTRNLIENENYSSVLIEGDKGKSEELKKNYKGNSKVTTINKFVGYDDKDNLDHILKKTPIPVNFDFLSIDIDGNDYHVWAAMLEYKPKVICIEFNPTIPTEVEFVQKADPNINQGASLLTLVKLAKKKEYELVCVVECNAFFVKKRYYPLFGIENNSPERLRTNLDSITYLFVGYDGKIFLDGCKNLPWHGVKISESRVQVLPKFLQTFPGNYNWFQKKIFEFIKRFFKIKRSIFKTSQKFKWVVKGKPVPPPHVVKQECIKEFQKKEGINILVETGTYLGDMVEAQLNNFKTIYSIELSEKLFKKAKKRFEKFDNVEILHGDSGEVLSKILPKVKEPAIFWLDGHYSGGITAKGEKESPIIEELDAIFISNIEHIILIDDARLFDGKSDYPTLKRIKKQILLKYQKSIIEVKDDIIRIKLKK